MVVGRERVIVEIVAGVSPDRAADGVELAVDVVVVAPKVQLLQLAAILTEPHDCGKITSDFRHFAHPTPIQGQTLYMSC